MIDRHQNTFNSQDSKTNKVDNRIFFSLNHKGVVSGGKYSEPHVLIANIFYQQLCFASSNGEEAAKGSISLDYWKLL